MAKFVKKQSVDNEDAILAEYVALNIQAKNLEKKITPLKKVVLSIVKGREGPVEVDGMSITIASKPKRQFSDALEAELKAAKDKMDFLAIKVKRAIEDEDFTLIDAGEYVIVKAAKEAEE